MAIRKRRSLCYSLEKLRNNESCLVLYTHVANDNSFDNLKSGMWLREEFDDVL